mgnify:CR=1 FL=1|jgi:hypothetical protein
MNTITYVTDDNSPLTPNASLILGSTGGDAEEAWLRKNFAGLWDHEEGREFADALLEGLAAAERGEYDEVVESCMTVRTVEVTYSDDDLPAEKVQALRDECAAVNLDPSEAGTGEILSVLADIDDEIIDRLGL